LFFEGSEEWASCDRSAGREKLDPSGNPDRSRKEEWLSPVLRLKRGRPRIDFWRTRQRGGKLVL